MLRVQFKPNEPGAVALVAKNGNLVYRKAFGLAEVENQVQMTPQHVFGIGSMSKQFTAVGILMLMEQGLLTLEDSLTKYIPDYPPIGNKITLHHLLTHTSGIKSYTEMEKWRKVWRTDMNTDEMISLFKDEPVDFVPGEKWHYSNSGYFLLGVIIEKVSGMTYGEFVTKRIFEPLQMNNTFYGSHSRIIPNRARGYQRSNALRNAEYLSYTQPYSAGAIMSTADDLYTWHQAIQNHVLLKEETLKKAFTNYTITNGHPTYYGYGWMIDEINGSQTREHSGGIFGYSSNSIYLPQEDVYVVVLSNCNCNSPVEISIRIAASTIGKPYPKPIAKVKIDDKHAKSLVGTYVFEDGSSRAITVENGQFFSQRMGSVKLKIFPQDNSSFVFETGLSSLHFITEKKFPTKVLLKNRVEIIRGSRTETPKKVP